MKKILSLLLAFVLCLSVCACGKDGSSSLDDKDISHTEKSEDKGVLKVPEGFKNCFAYSTKDGSFIYKPETGETIKIGDEDYIDGGIILNDGKHYVASFDGELYYREIGSDSKGILIGQEISQASFSHDGKTMLFTSDDVLYKNVLGTEEFTEIAHNIYDFVASPDCNAMIYSTNDCGLYYYDGESRVISTAAYGPTLYISPDLKNTVYIENGNVMLFTVGEGSKTIAEGMEYGYVTDLNNMYFVKYDQSYNSSVYFYDGSEVSLICENAFYIVKGTDVLCYVEEVSVDPINDMYEYCLCVAKGKNVIKTDVGFIDDITVSASGKTVFYTEEGDLFKVTVGESLGTPELISGGVTSYNLTTFGESAIYLKETGDVLSDLYLDKQLICKGGKFIYSIYSTDGLLYKDADGSLYSFRGGQSKLIFKSEEQRKLAGEFDFEDGSVICAVTNDNYDYDNVDMYYWNGTETKLVAEAATGFGWFMSVAYYFRPEIIGELSLYVPEPHDFDGDSEFGGELEYDDNDFENP